MKITHEVTYRNDDMSCEAEYWRCDGLLHRIGGPAVTWYRRDGSRVVEYWYKDGKRHREGAPAAIFYTPQGEVKSAFSYLHGREVVGNLTEPLDVAHAG